MEHSISRTWRAGIAGAMVAVIQFACTPVVEQRPPQPIPQPVPPPVAAPTPPPPPPPVVAIARPAPPPTYRSIDEYKRALARHIFSSNTGSVVAGELQPLLRAVVVLQFNVDASGSVRNVKTLRTPESDADRLARNSLQRAGAVPVPDSSMLSGGLVEITETWLFNNDGKFHLRTLGPRQRTN